MSSTVSIPLIFTPCLVVSHIIIVHEEPEVLMFALYGNLVHNNLENIVLQCNFTQMNDLLHHADYVDDKTIEQLSHIVSSASIYPQTVDVTDSGGILFSTLLFCIEPVSTDAEPQTVWPEEQVYFLYDFIKKEESVLPYFEKVRLPDDPIRLAHYYLSALSLQYDFYLHFITKKLTGEQALHKTGLTEELVFMLSKAAYDCRQKIKAEAGL